MTAITKPVVVFLLLFAGIIQPLFAQNKPLQQGNIISASDIHFNPFFDPSLVDTLVKAPYRQWQAIFNTSKTTQPNGYNSDSNFPLLQSALAAMKQQNASPAFMIITGDFLCHNFQSNFAKYAPSYPDSLKSFTSKTIQFMALMFNQYFPKTVVLPVLGNNDSFCGDYMVEPDGQFLAMFARAWVPLQRNHNLKADKAFVTSFSKGGYYTYSLRDGLGSKLVMLNTVFLSYKYTNCGTPTQNPAAIELNWLRDVLKQGKLQKSRLWLAAHIPPGIDVNSTLNGKGNCTQNIRAMLNDSCNRVYLQLLTQYAPVIKAGFAGHTHMDDFRLLYSNGRPVSFMHITPAVSPLFANNPGFQCISYSKASFGLLNIQTYYYNLNLSAPVWGLEYDYQKTYDITAINPQTLNQVRKEIAANPVYLAKYRAYYDVRNPNLNGINLNNWKAYWCATGNLTTADFTACYCNGVMK